jgi:SAM-dependent methyltransferase
MTEESLLFRDETSRKYFRFSTRWITGIFIGTIIQLLRQKRPETLLDIGCGTGYITDKIKRSVDTGVVCCDVDFTRLLFAKKEFGLETVLADVRSLPFKNGAFDTVLATEVIEHIPDLHPALEEIERVAGNNVIITVPNDPWFMLANFFRGKNLATLGNPPDHINHFNKRSLKTALSASRFSKVEVTGNAFLWLLADADK